MDLNYTLIADYSVWGKGKTHVAKEIHTVHSLCGRELGFNYNPLSESGFEGGTDLILKKEDILKRRNMCKKCLLSLASHGIKENVLLILKK